jgi:excisionase family DNA binding protein
MKKNKTGIPRAAISVEEAAEALGIGRTYAFQLIKEGALETCKMGRRRLVPVKAVDALLARMRKP